MPLEQELLAQQVLPVLLAQLELRVQPEQELPELQEQPGQREQQELLVQQARQVVLQQLLLEQPQLVMLEQMLVFLGLQEQIC